MFGSGGFLYSLYLNGRLASKEQMRATQSALIGCSTFVRLGLFLLAGLYAAREPGCSPPACCRAWRWAWIGRRVTLRLSREAFVRLVTWLVLCSGLALVGRYLALGGCAGHRPNCAASSSRRWRWKSRNAALGCCNSMKSRSGSRTALRTPLSSSITAKPQNGT